MTSKEKELFDNLQKTINDLRESNHNLVEKLSSRIAEVEKSLTQKNEPIYLERDIVQATKIAIGKAIGESLNRYGSPLEGICKSVISKYEPEIKKLVENSIMSVFKEQKFIDYLNEEMAHKAARILIDSSKGICDSIINDLKNDNVFRAKLIVVVSDLIKEHRNNVQTT